MKLALKLSRVPSNSEMNPALRSPSPKSFGPWAETSSPPSRAAMEKAARLAQGFEIDMIPPFEIRGVAAIPCPGPGTEAVAGNICEAEGEQAPIRVRASLNRFL